MLGSCHFVHTQRSLRLPRGAALASSLGCSSSYSALDTDPGSGARPLLCPKGTRCPAAPLPVGFHPGGDALRLRHDFYFHRPGWRSPHKEGPALWSVAVYKRPTCPRLTTVEVPELPMWLSSASPARQDVPLGRACEYSREEQTVGSKDDGPGSPYRGSSGQGGCPHTPAPTVAPLLPHWPPAHRLAPRRPPAQPAPWLYAEE